MISVGGSESYYWWYFNWREKQAEPKHSFKWKNWEKLEERETSNTNQVVKMCKYFQEDSRWSDWRHHCILRFESPCIILLEVANTSTGSVLTEIRIISSNHRVLFSNIKINSFYLSGCSTNLYIAKVTISDAGVIISNRRFTVATGQAVANHDYVLA